MKVGVSNLSTSQTNDIQKHEACSDDAKSHDTSLAIDCFSSLPLDMHRKILGHATSKSINRLKTVSRLFRSRCEDPVVQASCLARFASRFEPLRTWEPILRASVNAPHELLPSDALLASRANCFRILNPANIKIVPCTPNWYTNARSAILRHGDQALGYVQIKPRKHGDAKRLIALHNNNDQMVGFAQIGSVWTHFAIQTFTPTPLGLANTPQLLKDIRDKKLSIGNEYFIVFRHNSSEEKPMALMAVPPEFELCRHTFTERVFEPDDNYSLSDNEFTDAIG